MTVYAQKIAGKETGRWIVEVVTKIEGPSGVVRKKHREIFPTEAKARKRNAELLKHGTKKLPSPREEVAAKAPTQDTKDLLELCLATSYTGKTPLYVQCQGTYMRRFVSWLEKTKVPLDNVNDATMVGWRAFVSSTYAKSPSGINQHMTAALTFLGYLYKARVISSVPRGSRVSSKRTPMRRPLSGPEEAKAFVQALRDVGYPQVADATLVGILTGLRRGTVMSLRPEWVQDTPSGPVIAIPRTKTSGRQSYPIDENTKELLSRCLPWQKLTVERIRTAYRLAHEKLGWSEENDMHFVFHGTRNTFGTWLTNSGSPTRAVQEVMGHSSIQTTQRYLDVAPELKRRIVSVLPSGELIGNEEEPESISSGV